MEEFTITGVGTVQIERVVSGKPYAAYLAARMADNGVRDVEVCDSRGEALSEDDLRHALARWYDDQRM